ncbi:MAG: hep Hag family protein, partial [Candidatus Doudnabacteria bacterium]|nr:hep Hag family protein [Candidatus Doudnabacteria bacterium]
MPEENQDKLNNFISLQEASEITGYHSDYLGFLARTGKLQAQKIGRNWVTTKVALDQLTHENIETEVLESRMGDIANENNTKTIEVPGALTPVIPAAVEAAPGVAGQLAHLKTEVFSNLAKRVANETVLQAIKGAEVVAAANAAAATVEAKANLGETNLSQIKAAAEKIHEKTTADNLQKNIDQRFDKIQGDFKSEFEKLIDSKLASLPIAASTAMLADAELEKKNAVSDSKQKYNAQKFEKTSPTLFFAAAAPVASAGLGLTTKKLNLDKIYKSFEHRFDIGKYFAYTLAVVTLAMGVGVGYSRMETGKQISALQNQNTETLAQISKQAQNNSGNNSSVALTNPPKNQLPGAAISGTTKIVYLQGKPGPAGPQGPAGTNGQNGQSGQNGQNGLNGTYNPGGVFYPTNPSPSNPGTTTVSATDISGVNLNISGQTNLNNLTAAGQTNLTNLNASGNTTVNNLVVSGTLTFSGSNGAFSSPFSVITSTAPQLTLGFDTSNNWTSSTNSNGATVFTFTGTNPSLVLSPSINSTNAFTFVKADGATQVLTIDTVNGRIGINNPAPATSLDVTGNANFAVSANSGNAQTINGLALNITDATTGTGGYTGLLVNTTGTGTGSGAKNLLDLNPGNANNEVVFDSTGSFRPSALNGVTTASLGSPTHYFKNAYFDTITANNLAGNVSAGSTDSNTWIIGAQEAADTNKQLIFQRNSGVGSATLQWNAGAGDLRYLTTNFPFNATYTVDNSSIATAANLYSGQLTNNTTSGTQTLLSLTNAGTGTTEKGIYLNNTGTGTTAFEIGGSWNNGIITNNNSINAGTGAVSGGVVTASTQLNTPAINSASGDLTIGTTSGNVVIQPSGTSTTGIVQIGAAGGGLGSASPDLLVLDRANGPLPTGVEGAIAIDSTGKFNIFEGGSWKVLCNKTDATCGAGSGAALSAVTAATTANTINNADFDQVWQWNALTAGSAFTLSSNSTAATANSQTILNILSSGANANSTQTTYGQQIANIHTGTASTNVGLSVSASGGTNNYGLLVASGSVGIGTAAPGSLLEVDSTATNDNNGIIQYQNPTVGDSNAQLIGKNFYGTLQVLQWSSLGARIGVRSTTNGGLGDLYLTSGSDVAGIVLKSSGNVGIGTSTPAAALDIAAKPIGGADGTALINATQIWNTSGNPTAIKLNITNTASGASALLQDLQVGSVSQFKVAKNGNVTATGTITGSNFSGTSSGTNTGDVTLSGQNYLSLTGQAITANAINLSGSNVTSILGSANGGTGVNNGSSTITLAGNLVTVGANALTLTTTGTTNVTLPTSGTLLTTTGSGAGLSNVVNSITGTANQVIASSSTGAVTLSLPQNIATTSTPQFAGVGFGTAGSAANLVNASLGSGQRLISAVQGTAETSGVNLLDIATTWSNAANTPTAFKLNVTDTASNAASLLADLQVGGVSQFKVAKNGNITATGSITATNISGTSSGTNTGDVTLSGENYLSLTGQALTANAVNLGTTNVTGT